MIQTVASFTTRSIIHIDMCVYRKYVCVYFHTHTYTHVYVYKIVYVYSFSHLTHITEKGM